MVLEAHGDLLKQLHLYVSKQTPERRMLMETAERMMRDVEGYADVLEEPSDFIGSLDEFLGQVKQRIGGNEKELQLAYAVTDYVLVTALIFHAEIGQVARKLSEKLMPFPPVHELAVLCWYDSKVPPETVIPIIGEADITIKERYHVLGEMSLRYPRVVLEAAKGMLDAHHLQRLVQKMRKSRTLGTNKNLEVVGSLEELNTWLEEMGI